MPVTEFVGILASGGLDSTVLTYSLTYEGKKVQLIYIDYGQHFKDTEINALRSSMPLEIFSNLKIIDVSSIYTESTSPLIKPHNLWEDKVEDSMLYVPYRTLVMLSAGMAYAQSIGCRALYAGFIDSNYVNDIDCSEEFFRKFDAVNDMYEGVDLRFPMRYMSKVEVVELGLKVSAPILLSYSCQINKEIPCGACANCVDRNQAMEKVSQGIE